MRRQGGSKYGALCNRARQPAVSPTENGAGFRRGGTAHHPSMSSKKCTLSYTSFYHT
ncbi:hypothetical protein L873DRAFT_1797702 [Choiromyces venosus 120613-1]|uniref:Uncharacterized protein n=1 Tax=Choiromyces venosus 120613-1 TaxID=1336337 RepID=A0A3N4K476_9PEZI|nr:hypothetical protein L873DRAFT_1797702 [Choiromyces venosus 120613-1]